MNWPTPQDYNEAIQNPGLCFADAELQEGSAELSPLGLPRPITGSFASVYRFHCRQRDFAVRCFLHNLQDQEARYGHLSKYVMNDDLVYTVSFDFLNKGIKVKGQWYPVLKMEWVQGQSLDSFIRQQVHDPASMRQLLERFDIMAGRLRDAGIAHGDLQHGNIIIVEDDLRLVDYDGMYVPALAGWTSNELGHRNYQHPERSSRHFGPDLDNFSAWVIHTSLRCLSVDPTLLAKLGGGDECLLFRQKDFQQPRSSGTFALLESHSAAEVRECARLLRFLIALKLEDMPNLREAPLPPFDLPALTLADAYSFYSLASGLPDWVHSVKAADKVVQPSAPVNYPGLDFYTLAISNPNKCFQDAELKDGTLALDHGAIRPLVGAQGVVYRVHTEAGDRAVKCFLKADAERDKRYAHISAYLKGSHPLTSSLKKYIVNFEYITNGIKVKGDWYPILKMDWAEGVRLDSFLSSHTARHKESFGSPPFLLLSLEFRQVMMALRDAGIAHGDLEPANILVAGGRIKLVDYDAMYVPSFVAEGCAYLSNEDLRHPSQNKQMFGPYIDNFPAWIIDTTLLALASQPVIWEQTGGGNGRLIFRASDFKSPWHSKVFALLGAHFNEDLKYRSSLLRSFLEREPVEIPYLNKDATLPEAFNPYNLPLPLPNQKQALAGSGNLPAQPRRNTDHVLLGTASLTAAMAVAFAIGHLDAGFGGLTLYLFGWCFARWLYGRHKYPPGPGGSRGGSPPP